MHSLDRDEQSICALATPVGTGALAIVRLSGSRALEIGKKVARFLPAAPVSHRVYLGSLYSPQKASEFDEALVTYFSKGKSFTGEETLEFSTHGSMAIVQELLKSLIESGAQAARPGEFTYRAFMNGKLDLVQAESVLSLIESQSSQTARQALRQLRGGLSTEIEVFESEVTWALAHIEAGIDFSTEGLETVSNSELIQRLSLVRVGLQRILKTYESGRLLNEGLRVVLIGRPNVGKSSLLNAILNEDRAIVTDVAGTTRDLIESKFIVEGVQVQIVDTAGLRESSDVVEKLGMDRSHQAAKEADLVLFVVDGSAPFSNEDLSLLLPWKEKPLVLLVNKMDRVPSEAEIRAQTHDFFHDFLGSKLAQTLFVSALNRIQVRQAVEDLVREKVKAQDFSDESLLMHSRHFELISRALSNLDSGLELISRHVSPELAAFELKVSLLSLQEVLGKHFDDQILDRVFKEFCLGK